MKKAISFFLLILGIFFLPQCNNPTSKASDEKNVADSTSVISDSTKTTETSIKSEITCPECGYKKMELMPTDVCLLKYTCEKCNTELHPREGDCCVFCTYGTHKCPSMQ